LISIDCINTLLFLFSISFICFYHNASSDAICFFTLKFHNCTRCVEPSEHLKKCTRCVEPFQIGVISVISGVIIWLNKLILNHLTLRRVLKSLRP
jgi:hypothetical protein